jgi:hypothetical protein
MNDPKKLEDADLERLKRKYGIDEKIARKHDLTVKQVEEFFDPRIKRILQQAKGRNQHEG